jgi:D-lyxose ketol-isomerase
MKPVNRFASFWGGKLSSDLATVAVPTVVLKNWGYEKIIVNNNLYCGKILHFFKGKTGSAHFHLKKDETFFVVFNQFFETLYESVS